MVMGSSDLPDMLISCMSALPMEVTRRETCIGLPSTLPSHEPARSFKLSKDFCASDWAKAAVESPSNTTASRKRFMLLLLTQPGSHGGDALGSTVILNYNTISLSRDFFFSHPEGVKGNAVGLP